MPRGQRAIWGRREPAHSVAQQHRHAFRKSDSKVQLAIPLKSPTAREEGTAPAGNGLPGAAVNPPAPLPNSTVTLLPNEFAMARSGFAIPVEVPYRHGLRELIPPEKRAARGHREPARTVAQQNRYSVASSIGNGEVQLAIPVEIPHRH